MESIHDRLNTLYHKYKIDAIPKEDKVIKQINYVYEKCGLKKPEIIVYDTASSCLKRINKINFEYNYEIDNKLRNYVLSQFPIAIQNIEILLTDYVMSINKLTEKHIKRLETLYSKTDRYIPSMHYITSIMSDQLFRAEAYAYILNRKLPHYIKIADNGMFFAIAERNKVHLSLVIR